MWPVQTDEVQVKVELDRDDEIVRVGVGPPSGGPTENQMVPTGIMVSMLNTASSIGRVFALRRRLHHP